MKRLFALPVIAILAAAPAFAADIAAVRIHADWCPNCRALDPKLEAAKAELGDDLTIRYIRLDYTKRNKAKLWEAADEAGIREPLQSYLGDKVKTGLLILINEETGEVVGKASSDFSEAELKGALQAAAAS